MEVRWEVFVIIFSAALVTLLPRVLPLVLLSRIQLPEWGIRWLNHIPVAVMAALLAQELFVSDSRLEWQPERLMAAVPAFIVAFLTRSLLLTVVTGVLAMFLITVFI